MTIKTASCYHKYALPLRLLHWLGVVLMGSVIALGFMLEELGDNGILAHLIAGGCLFVLTLGRLALYRRYPRPPYPSGVDSMSRTLAKGVQQLMLVLMLFQPVLGLVVYSMPQVVEKEIRYDKDGSIKKMEYEREFTTDTGEFLAQLHECMAFALLLLITLHIAGVVKHAMLDRINLLRRMC